MSTTYHHERDADRALAQFAGDVEDLAARYGLSSIVGIASAHVTIPGAGDSYLASHVYAHGDQAETLAIAQAVPAAVVGLWRANDPRMGVIADVILPPHPVDYRPRAQRPAQHDDGTASGQDVVVLGLAREYVDEHDDEEPRHTLREIKQAVARLVDRLGVEKAREIMRQNPRALWSDDERTAELKRLSGWD